MVAFAFAFVLLESVSISAAAVFPGASWEEREPEELGVDAARLDELAEMLGGRGCVIKDGYLVKSWRDLAARNDWHSSAKPVLSTLLFFAIEEGLVESVDQRVADFGWPLKPKDETMTFRHWGSMTSGYARPEPPGEAWSYNDYAIQLYQNTLFDRVFKADPKIVAEDPRRMGALRFQDGLEFNGKRRIFASVRDFARIAWFWLNRGRWGDRQILPAHYFDEFMRPQTPKNLPQTAKAETDDYFGIGTYGGGSDHFSDAGPGIYGFNWWFNDTGRMHPHLLTWPDAPPDTVMSLGGAGHSSAIIPSLNVALVCAQGNWGEVKGGNFGSRMNEVLKTLAQACGYRNGPGYVVGGFRKWHPITLSFFGPNTSESATPNPFTDFRLDVTFVHDQREYRVPGHYAADGNAGESGAEQGNVWRVHFVPDAEGEWTYRVSFRSGPNIAVGGEEGISIGCDGATGRFQIAPADAAAPGFPAKRMLRYVGKRYLQFAETGEYFVKGGADSPENLLAFADFDGTPPTHRFEPHAHDWRIGDPIWRDGKGKNLVGALNYLAGKGMNSVYFLTMNVVGDGKDVWPWTGDAERFRFDCSKLDQWEVCFSHMDRLGLLLHVVTQEQENDQLLDDGDLGPERKGYYRELVARFGHHLALVWNLGEENTNTDAQRKAFAEYLRALDPYDHPIVAHTFPGAYDKVYQPLLGFGSFEGPSLQIGDMTGTYTETLKWVQRTRDSGRPWFVCLDEIGPSNIGVKPDAEDPAHDEVRRHGLWGNLMAGGAGCEWFFQSDLKCEDWRSRERMWDLTRYALEFFQKHLPFAEMEPNPGVIQAGDAWCLSKPSEVYAIYTWNPGAVRLELPEGRYRLSWYNPREGGPLIPGDNFRGGTVATLGPPPSKPDNDWAILIVVDRK
ncbi:MAG: DUF5060 domain-containing protein [Candidatus Hydrogenedentes bacterium]|nr:DUF5060 domain-containing protein [Candidatus Hydrogenedentota bacterium]